MQGISVIIKNVMQTRTENVKSAREGSYGKYSEIYIKYLKKKQ
jgi:hypothetical protein